MKRYSIYFIFFCASTLCASQDAHECTVVTHGQSTAHIQVTAAWADRARFVQRDASTVSSDKESVSIIVPGAMTPQQQQLTMLTDTVAALQEDLATLTSAQDTQVASLQSLQALTQTLQTDLAALLTEVRTHDTAIVTNHTALQSQVTVLEGLLGAINVAALAGTVTTLSTQLAQVQKTITGMQDSISGLLDASSMSNVVAALSDSVDLVKGSLAQITTDVTELQSNMTALIDGPFTVPLTPIATSADADTLAVQVADHITQMQVKANLLEARIKEMETLVANLPLMHVQSDGTGLDALTQFSVANALTRSPFAGVELRQTVRYAATEMLDVDRNMHINGNHESLVFSNVPRPQVMVRAGKTLRLENITFKNIHARTIVVEGPQYDAHGSLVVPAGTIECGANVSWELHDDIAFDEGTFVLNNSCKVMHMSGVGGVRTMHMRGKARFDVGVGTLALHNVTLCGADNVTSRDVAQAGTDVVLTGAVGLCGNAQLRVAQRLAVSVVVVGSENSVWCQSGTTDLTSFGRTILFAPDGRNELRLTVAHQPNHAAGLFLDADSLLVESAYGSAHLYVETHDMVWHLLDERAVYVGPRGTIHGHNIHVNGGPLNVAHTRTQPVLAAGTTVSGSADMHNVLTRAHTMPPHSYTTALHTVRKDLIPVLPPSLGAGTHDEYSGTTTLKRMKGAVVVDGGTIEAWALEPITEPGVGSAQITLRDGACLVQAQATTLKSIDSITVAGAGNKIVVTDELVWHGPLHCEQGSELTIECRRGGRIVCDNTSWTFEQGAQIRIEGPGELVCTGVTTMLLDGLSAEPVSLTFAQGLVMQVVSEATLNMHGIGTIAFDEAAECQLAPHARWVCGQAGIDTDALTFTLDRGARIMVGYDASACTQTGILPARWSLGYGSFSLLCSRNAGVTVAAHGIFECNVRSGGLAKGRVDKLSFVTGGHLHLAGGIFLMGASRENSDITWHENSGGIYGSGQVGTLSGASMCTRPELPTFCQNETINATQFRQKLTQ